MKNEDYDPGTDYSAELDGLPDDVSDRDHPATQKMFALIGLCTLVGWSVFFFTRLWIAYAAVIPLFALGVWMIWRSEAAREAREKADRHFADVARGEEEER